MGSNVSLIALHLLFIGKRQLLSVHGVLGFAGLVKVHVVA